MTPELQRVLMDALERPHRLGTIGGDLAEQLAHCAGFSAVLGSVADFDRPSRLTCVDLGTGGGLPGVVLAALHPGTLWTLIEMRAARADEVERTVLRLGLAERVDVVAEPAQQTAHHPDTREHFDIAVARSFGPSSLVAECAAGLLVVGGVLIVSEPPESSGAVGVDRKRWPPAGLASLGLGEPEIHVVEGRRFAAIPKVAALEERLPRLPARSERGWIVG